MPSLGQKVDLLFKKYITLKGTVNAGGSNASSFTPTSTAFHQEFFGSKPTITAEQIWTETKYLPLTTNPLNKADASFGTMRVTGSAGALFTDGIDASNPNAPILLVDGKAVVQRLDLTLNNINGSPYSWSFATQDARNPVGSASWTGVFGPTNTFSGYNIIPLAFDPTGTRYRYQLYRTKNDGVADAVWGTTYTLSGEVPLLDPSDWFFDQDALVLNFMSETLPSGLSSSSPLYIRVYRYIGKVGDFASSDQQSSLSSSTAYLENATTAADLDVVLLPTALPGANGLYNTKESTYVHVQSNFAHPNGPSGTFTKGQLLRYSTTLNKWEVIAPTNGLRLLCRSEDIIDINTYKPVAPGIGVTIDDDVLANTILEYWKASVRGTAVGTDGFVKIAPVSNQRIAIDADANKIWVFNGSKWIEENVSNTKGSLSNKDMVANVTGPRTVLGVTTYNIKAVDTPLLEIASGGGYIEVQVNGVSVRLGDGYDDLLKAPSACFGNILPAYTYSATAGNTFTLNFAGPQTLQTNDHIAFITNDGVVHICTVTMSGANVTIPNTDIPTGSPQAYLLRKYAKIEVGDVLVWFGGNAKYELDTNDNVSYIYVASV